MATIGGSNIVRSGLVLHLDAANPKSYVNGSTSWFDLSGNGNTGTLTNGPTFNSGNGGSVVFDGVNDYSNTSNKFMTGFTAFTFCGWTRIGAVSGGGSFCSYNIQTLHSGPQFYVFSNSMWLTVYNTNGSNFFQSTISTTITPQTWYFVCSSWIPGQIKLYVNGSSIAGTNSQLGAVPSSVAGDSQGQQVSFKIGNALTNQSYYNGNVALTQVYNRALSDTEVLQNYNATRSRFNL